MTVMNARKSDIRSNLSVEDFAKAMAALDVPSIPPEKRAKAVMDRLARLIIEHATDRSKVADVATAYLLRSRLR